MITDFDVYKSFRKAQANANNRGYKIPRDFDDFLEKMNSNNREWLQRTTIYFNTSYRNIDIDKYMECGFEIWKSFTYKNFLHEKIMVLYISKDKARKRQKEVALREIDRAIHNYKIFVNSVMVR